MRASFYDTKDKREAAFLVALVPVLGGYSILMQLPLMGWVSFVMLALSFVDLVHEALVKVRELRPR